MTPEHQAVLRSFRALGGAVVGLGQRLNRIGSEFVTIGRRLGRIAPRDLEDLRSLRKPADELRALVEVLATLTTELRELVGAIVGAVGVDN